MVVRFTILLFLILSSSLMALSDVSVSATIDSSTLYEGWPIEGTLEIMHDSSQKIDESSVTLDGKPLKISLLRDVQISPDSPIRVTIYRFALPAQKQGTLNLSPIKVMIGGTIYQTLPNTYTIQAPIAGPPVSNTPEVGNVSLKLEAFIDGPKELYPGQLTRLVYRYIYAGNIDLSHEVLPMLDATGVQKVGRYDINNSSEGNASIFEISQQVQAIKPGEFSWGPSTIEGVVYEQDSLGNKQYTTTKLQSEAPAVKLVVKPFPEKDRPASFNGAFGQLKFDVKLISPAKISVGDPVQLNMTISGKTSNWDSVNLPEICCQPGFAGFFKMGDLPPIGKMDGETKHYLVVMHPLSSVIRSVPSIQFSFFEPESGTYKTLFSTPIGLEVAPLKDIADVSSASTKEKIISQETAQEWKQIYSQLSPIGEKTFSKLSVSDLEGKRFGSWWSLWLIPFSLALVVAQLKLRDVLKQRALQVKPITSSELYEKMTDAPAASQSFFQLLHETLLLKLKESGIISSTDLSTDDLPNTGKAGIVRAFLLNIEKQRYYSEMSDMDIYKQSLEDGKKIYRDLSRGDIHD